MEIIEVTWKDAISDEGIYNDENMDCIKPLEVTSVGYLWIDDKEKLVIAREYFPENNYRGIVTIPRELVMSIRKLS